MNQDDSRVVAEACRECGMPCEPNEYHPYAACLMFRGCLDSSVVRGNLLPMIAERDSLQSRLDAVAALADQWEGVVRQMGGHDTPHTDAAINTCVKEIRAALGGECRGDGEERK